MIKIIFTLLLLSFSLGANSAQAGEDCAKRLQGDSYLSAVRACVQLGALNVADVEKIVAGKAPSNPLNNATPLSKTSSARKLLTMLSNDPQVQAEWPRTRLRLQQYLHELRGDKSAEHEAQKQTVQIVAPHEIGQISFGTSSLKWSELGDGSPIAATIDGDSLVVRNLKNQILFKETLPKYYGWDFEWHDEDGLKWLYLVAKTTNVHEENTLTKVFRVNLRDKKFLPVPYNSKPGEGPSSFKSAGPGWLILHSYVLSQQRPGHLLHNFDHGRAVQMHENLRYDDLILAVRANGKLATRTQPSWRKTENLLRLQNKHAFRFTLSSEDKLVIVDEDDASFKFESEALKNHWPDVSALNAFETRNGHLYVAVLRKDSGTGAGDLTIFKPFTSKEPYYELPLNAGPQNPKLHFFSDLGNNVYLGEVGGGILRILDMQSKSEIFTREIRRIEGWYTSRTQTLFWRSAGNHWSVWGIFPETPSQD